MPVPRQGVKVAKLLECQIFHKVILLSTSEIATFSNATRLLEARQESASSAFVLRDPLFEKRDCARAKRGAEDGFRKIPIATNGDS